MNYDEIFMREALKAAQRAQEADEVPVGAVITCKNQIIAKAHNQVELLKDPTAHAEMIAITQATNALSTKWLEGCTLYVTLEPCAMCAGAMVLARIDRVCFGAFDPKSGASGSVVNVLGHPRLNHRPEVNTGIFATDCGGILTEYFLKKRAAKGSQK
ncbi:MAG: nucleoside deaminase [Candidatus Omnitrophica bacterium]|nr:nucleoside deaminase [Candidatus Omnitrophota bacterium]